MEGLCERCGAMLPPPDLDGVQACPSCGHTVQGEAYDPDRPVGPPSAPSGTGPPPPGASAPGAAAGGDTTGGTVPPPPGAPVGPGRAPRRAGRGCGCGTVLTLLIVAAIGFGVWALLGAIGVVTDLEEVFDGLAGTDRTVTGDVVVVPGEPARPLDAVALTYRYDRGRGATVHEVVRFADGDGSPAWSGEPLDGSASRIPLALAGTDVVSVEDGDVVARALGDGTTRWRTPLTDVVAGTCEGCLQVVGDRVVAVPDDGVVHALALADGSVAWTRRLEEPRGRVAAVGASLWVVDAPGGTTSVAVVDPADGTEVTSFPLACALDGSVGSSAGTDLELVVLADGDVLLGYGTWPGCWERRAPDGTLRWQAADEDLWFAAGVPWTTDGTTLLSSDSEGGLLVVDLATGAVGPVAPPPDAELAPLAAGSDVVLALARTTRGTSRWSVVAYDRATLAERWQVPLDGAEPVLPDEVGSDVVSSDEVRVVLHRHGDAVLAVAVDGSDGSVRTGGMAVADGSPLPGARADVPGARGTTRLAPVGWDGSRALLVIDGALVELDVATGEVLVRYGG